VIYLSLYYSVKRDVRLASTRIIRISSSSARSPERRSKFAVRDSAGSINRESRMTDRGGKPVGVAGIYSRRRRFHRWKREETRRGGDPFFFFSVPRRCRARKTPGIIHVPVLRACRERNKDHTYTSLSGETLSLDSCYRWWLIIRARVRVHRRPTRRSPRASERTETNRQPSLWLSSS